MKFRFIIGLAALCLSLGACQSKKEIEEANDFKPYIANEQQALPGAYPNQVWAYPQGTPTRDVVARWNRAGLVMGVYNRGVTEVEVGPQFYNLSGSGQRGLADAIAQMFNTNHFLLIDYYRHKGVGVYTPQGLQLY
jgi:hypothetical protein